MDTTERLIHPYPEAMALLGGIGRSTLLELIDQKKLTRVNVGRRAFITAESLREYVDSLSGAA
jgi:excisionase family DNA binding protein